MPRAVAARLPGVVICLSLAACVDAGMRNHAPAGAGAYGPPPAQAPDGTRYRLNDGTLVIYREPLTAYEVTGHTDTYYHGGWFYSLGDRGRQVAPSVRGPWKTLRGPLPPGIAEQYPP